LKRRFEAHFADEIGDEPLRLLFVCCHEAVPAESRVAMALRTLCGFSTAEIARALLTTDANVQKRIERARDPMSDAAESTMKKATTTMKKTKSGVEEGKGRDSPSQRIDARIKELSDWRGETLARVRILIKQADPEVVEEWKWVKPTNPGTPVWSHEGMICTGETYKNVVKFSFAKGASLPDPAGLFNSSLEGNTRRAIDFHEGDQIDEKALQALIRAAVALNTSASASARPVRSRKRPKSA
jgi:hypothetical protein